jgi:cell division transport system permease protein
MVNAYRILKLGVTNFWRNGLLSMAATLILTMTLFTISVFVTLILVGNSAIESVNSRIDIVAYFNDEATEQQILSLRKELSVQEGVRSTEYISKEKAFEKWQGRAQDERLKEVITKEDNPLPRSLEINMTSPEQTGQIADFLQKEEIKPLLHRVRYNKEVIERLTHYTGIVKKIGLGLVGIFVIISILVVFNTIRLAIYARRDEVEIMKLVGATATFVRTPFLVEGALFGILSAILASAIILLGGKWLIATGILPSGTFREIVSFLGEDAMEYFSQNKFLIFIYQALIGVAIGLGCSWVAIYKYLSFRR